MCDEIIVAQEIIPVKTKEPDVNAIELNGYIKNDTSSSNGKPRITWNAVTGAETYQVYRSLSGGTDTFSRISTTANKSLTNTSTEAGTTYYYKVRAVFADGSFGEFSNVVVLTTPSKQLAKTIVLEGYIREDKGKPRITWNAVEGAESYQVDRSLSGETGTFSRISTTTNKSLTNTSAKSGNTYYYKVRAVFEDGSKGAFSNVVVLTI